MGNSGRPVLAEFPAPKKDTSNQNESTFLKVGDRVRLIDVSEGATFDTSAGPLRPGEEGVVSYINGDNCRLEPIPDRGLEGWNYAVSMLEVVRAEAAESDSTISPDAPVVGGLELSVMSADEAARFRTANLHWRVIRLRLLDKYVPSKESGSAGAAGEGGGGGVSQSKPSETEEENKEPMSIEQLSLRLPCWHPSSYIRRPVVINASSAAIGQASDGGLIGGDEKRRGFAVTDLSQGDAVAVLARCQSQLRLDMGDGKALFLPLVSAEMVCEGQSGGASRSGTVMNLFYFKINIFIYIASSVSLFILISCLLLNPRGCDNTDNTTESK